MDDGHFWLALEQFARLEPRLPRDTREKPRVDMSATPLHKPPPWREVDGSVWLDIPDGRRVLLDY